MNTFTVSLFGHREIYDLRRLENVLTPIIKKLLQTKAFVSFLIGRNGEFDEFAASVIKSVRKKIGEENSDITLILPYKVADIHYYEKFYDNISCSDYLIYQLQYLSPKIFDQVKKIDSNKQKYQEYLCEVETIEFGQFQCPIGKLKLDKLLNTEKSIVNKAVQTPVTQFNITVTLYCSKINGRIYDRKIQSFCVDEIFSFINRLKNKSGTFYNDRDIWNSLCRVERGKVSNKMRFSIYERDGYRCRRCGISERYAVLEIDHIIPISKGGKSTYGNLQTLCRKCNYEKGNKRYY